MTQFLECQLGFVSLLVWGGGGGGVKCVVHWPIPYVDTSWGYGLALASGGHLSWGYGQVDGMFGEDMYFSFHTHFWFRLAQWMLPSSCHSCDAQSHQQG